MIYCTYCQFNIQQIHVLPTQCICVFCVDLRTISYYNTNLFVFINEAVFTARYGLDL